MKGVVPLREVAERMGVSPRCAKRRLRKYDARIGGGLLVQFAPGGNWFVDLAMLRRHLPGLVEDDPTDPMAALPEQVGEVRELLVEVLAGINAIRTAVGA